MGQRNAIDAYLEMLKEFREFFGKASYNKRSMEDPEKKNRKIFTVINTVWNLTNDEMYKNLSGMAEKLSESGFYVRSKKDFDVMRVISDIDDVIERMQRLNHIDHNEFENFGEFVAFFIPEDNVNRMVSDFGGGERDKDVINVCSFIMACLFFSIFNEENLNEIYNVASKSSYGINEDSAIMGSDNQPSGKYLASFYCQLGGGEKKEDYEHFMILGENFDDVKKKFVDFIGEAVENMHHEPTQSDYDSSEDYDFTEFPRAQFKSSFNYFKDKMLQTIKKESDFDSFFYNQSGFFDSCGIPVEIIERDAFYTEAFIGFNQLYQYSDLISYPNPKKYFKDFTIIGDPALVGKEIGERAKTDFRVLAAFDRILNYQIGTESETRTVREKYPDAAESFQNEIGEDQQKKLPSISRLSKGYKNIKNLYESK